jgi:hypothetical protein
MNGQRELEKQAYLLRGLKLDLEAISKIKNQGRREKLVWIRYE